MRRWIPLSAVVAVALVVGLVALVVREAPASVSQPVAATASEDPSAGDENDRGEGHGPPPWAGGGHDKDDRRQGHKAWHDAWKAMTPKQREQMMERLAAEHEDGMRDWVRCVADGGDDCERPLPPGQAKKQLRP